MHSWMNRAALWFLAGIVIIACLAGCTAAPSPAAPIELPEEASEPQAEQAGQAHNTSLSAFSTADFSGPSICTVCHMRLTDQSGADVSMPTTWRSTMMANAAKDPLWQAKVSSEVARLPRLQAEIEKKCTTCHMPMAKTQAVTDGQPVAALGDGFYDPDHPLHAAGLDGVSCTLCHQVQGENLGSKESASGGFLVDTSTEPPARPLFGPYQDPVTQEMQSMSGFVPTYGQHMESSEHCGTCHNLYTPYVDAQGNVLGEFPEQTPYTEWQHSQAGAENQSCQACHMPKAEGGVVISTIPANLQAREPFYRHFFVGGNAFMLQILTDHSAALSVTADEEHLNETKGRVLEQISGETAQLVLESVELKNHVLTAALQVVPLTGHKFPTSFPTRRAWLHVVIQDAAGQPVFESGRPEASGAIAGNAADVDPGAYEPHYDVITQADQVQIYEPIMGNNEGEVTYTLLRAAQYLKDNRLLPAGAVKDELPADIAVYGAAAGDENFVGGSDLVTYAVDVSGAEGPFTLTAELLYQPLSHQFVQDLLADETPLTDRFGDYYGPADKTPLLVAKVSSADIR